MNEIIKIIKSLEHLFVLADSFTETVKHEIKNQEGGFLSALLPPSIVQPVTSSVVVGITGKGVIRAERGSYNNMRVFSSTPSFK